jgi:hypothetical protein
MSAKSRMGSSCKTRSVRKASIDANPAAHPAAPGQGFASARYPRLSPQEAAKAVNPPRFAPPLARPRAATGSHRGSVPGPQRLEEKHP